MPHEKYEPGSKQLAEKLHLHHMKVCPNYSFIIEQSRTCLLTYEICLWPGAHTCRQTCASTKAHRTWSLLLLVWDIRLPLSVSLCFCALRCFLVSQFYELLCCSQKHERQRRKDELEAKGRMKSDILNKKPPQKNNVKITNMKVDTDEGKMAGRQSNCLSRFVSRPVLSHSELTIRLCL